MRHRYLIKLMALPKDPHKADPKWASLVSVMNLQAYFVFSFLLHINMMNGKHEQKIV